MPPRTKADSANWLEAMRRDWDARARENPRAYINWPDVPNEEGAFFESGRKDYERFVLPFLKRLDFDPRDKDALEVGCGIGRIARRMAEDFNSVTGVDISPEMVAQARNNVPRARFETISGEDLAPIPSASADFVFSFAVFQHVPSKEAILNYFRESARVLRPGGVYRFQLKALWTLPLGSLLLEAGLTRTTAISSAGLSRVPFVRVRRLDTWQGRSIPLPEARRALEEAGLEVLEVEGAWTTMMWLGGRKPTAQS